MVQKQVQTQKSSEKKYNETMLTTIFMMTSTFNCPVAHISLFRKIKSGFIHLKKLSTINTNTYTYLYVYTNDRSIC